jgi:hypothetical protein
MKPYENRHLNKILHLDKLTKTKFVNLQYETEFDNRECHN